MRDGRLGEAVRVQQQQRQDQHRAQSGAIEHGKGSALAGADGDFRHSEGSALRVARRGKTGEAEWGASVARCPPNRAYRLCSDSERLIVIGTCVLAR